MSTQDIYAMIEQNVISQLENGIIPWKRCYHVNEHSVCVSHSTGRMYSLLNQMILGEPGEYWTFNQARSAGYSIRKGSHARKVVFWKVLNVENGSVRERGDGTFVEDTSQVPFLRWYNVFHESDVDGLPVKYVDNLTDEERARKNAESIQIAENVISDYLAANKQISVLWRPNATPSFSPSDKIISMPQKCQFDTLQEYYSTFFHEMVHSTKEACGRKQSNGRRSNDYAREELVAEIGAAFLCGYCGINEEDVIKNNSSYCVNWLGRLRNNIQDLVWASGKAEKAVKHILGDKATEIFGEPKELTAEA